MACGSEAARRPYFPMDVLKVDRGFVQRLEKTNQTARQDQADVQDIIGMARALGLEVIAEEVETVARRDRLRRLSCDYMQGFLSGLSI
jgi:EAL domain-containing protein (putative c-di-GMP-specific phosphodiesterase class I)